MEERPLRRLWRHLTNQFRCDPRSIHGPSHWRRVEHNGLLIAPKSCANVTVVRLFAVFHDACRVNENRDDGHGARGAALAISLRGVLFDLPDQEFELLHRACTEHTDGQLCTDATIGTCWDADRLDLGRVGIHPQASFMSTEYGRHLPHHKRIP